MGTAPRAKVVHSALDGIETGVRPRGPDHCVPSPSVLDADSTVQSLGDSTLVPPSLSTAHSVHTDRLVRAIQELSLRRDLASVTAVVRTAARELMAADGAAFVLREGDECFYVDEDAISPLWKGKRFPLATCVSGWVMEHGQPVVIEDIYADPRVPVEAYRPTFVKSLAIVPIRAHHPVGAIGIYWGSSHKATEEEVQLLQALADSTSIALENVKLYAELEQRAQEAEQAVRIRDDFLSAAAHELRTPLTTLQLQLDLLDRDTVSGVTDMGIGRVERARASCHRLSDLIDMLLTATHSAGELVLMRAPCDLVEVLKKVLLRCSPEAERNGCRLEFDSPASVMGEWDAVRLAQVASCLVSNAVRYGVGHPVRVEIEAGPNARLTVSDWGSTIPEAEFATLFQRFTRTTADRTHAGLGLGLYVARLIAHAHGGTLTVESGVDHGTAFTVHLPYVPPPHG